MTNNTNDKTGALAGLLNKLDLPTLLMVLLMGGGNFLATKEDGKLTREEALQVTREVHALHAALGDFEARQKDTTTRLTVILEGQNKQMDNQTRMLENQERVLTELRRWQQEFKKPEQ